MNTRQQHIALDPALLHSTLAAWQQQWPHLGLLAFVPEAEKDQVGRLQQVCRDLDLPLFGAIFPALLTDEGFSTEGAWLLGLEQLPPAFLVENLDHDGANRLATAIGVAQAAGGSVDPDATLLLFFDAMVPNIGSLMDAVHQRLSAPPQYAGVNAGSETFQPMPCLFDREQLIGNAVLGFVLPAYTKSVVHHAYPVSKSLMQASASDGNRIVSINGRAAFDVYQEVMQAEYGVALTRENFYEYAVHFPFGVVMAMDVLVRIPVALGDDGSLICVGEIAPNSMLRLLRAPALENSRCVAEICEKLDDMGANPGALMTFYCAGRRMHFGTAAAQEVAQLKALSHNQRLFGALSLGEIDSLEDLGFPRFHNAALVCVASTH